MRAQGSLPAPRPLCAPRRGLTRLGPWILSHLLPAPCAGCANRLGIDQRQGVCLECWRRLDPRPRHACARCAEILPAGGGALLCRGCRRRPPPCVRAVALWEYEGAARGVVLAFKYGGLPGLARPLAEALLRTAGPIDGGPDAVLVPVPLHPRRLRQRGGHDSLLALAGEIAALHTEAAAVAPRVAACLERPWRDVPQAGLSRAERRRNAAESFILARPELVFGRRAILLDDVLTTGATAFACSRLLLDGGARQVHVLALARAGLQSAADPAAGP